MNNTQHMNMFKFMRFFQIRRSLLVGILFIFCGALGLHIQATHAAVCDFQSVGTSDFNTDANWSCGHVPTSVSADVATIRAGTTTVLSADVSVTYLNVTGTIATLSHNLNVVGSTSVASTGSVTSTSGVFTFSGSVTSTGIIGAPTQSGDMLFGDTFQNNGTFDVGSGTVTTTGNFVNAGTVSHINSGTLDIMADFTTSTGDAIYHAGASNSNILRVVGSGNTQNIRINTVNGGLNDLGTLTVNKSSGTLNLNVPNNFAADINLISGILDPGSSRIFLNHAFTVSGGTFLPGTSYVRYTLSSGVPVSVAGVNYYDLDINPGGNLAAFYFPLAGSTTISGDLSLDTSTTLQLAGNDLTVLGTVTIPALANVTSSSGNMNFYGDVLNSGTVSSTGGTLSLRGASDQSFGGSGSINLYDFTLNKTAGTVTLTGNVTSTNTVTLTSGNLDIGNYRFAALGANYNNTGAVVTVGDSGVLHHPPTSFSFSDSTGDVPVFSFQNGSFVYIGTFAPARNLDASAVDSFTIPLTMAAGAGSDAETITLTETGVASGLFVNAANLLLVTGTVVHNNGQLELTSSGLATAAYTNVYDPSDTSSTTATMNAAALSSNVDNNTGGGGAIGSSGSSSLPPLVTQNQSGPSGSAANLNNLKTLGISIHALVKLPDDGKASTQEDSAVYYIGTDGMRHAFPNSKIYFTWYTDFSQVQLVSATQLASIPLGKNVTYKPGVRMVKFTTDPKVYAVDKGGVLRYVTTEAVATALYGSAWNTMIDDLSDAFFTNYTFGTNISSGADFNPSALKASVKLPSESLGM